MTGKKGLHMLAFLLLVVGGLNWLLVGVWQWDLVASLLGGMASTASRVVYVLVGLSALYLLLTHKGDCKLCGMKSMPMM